MSKLKESFTILTESDFIWPVNLITDLPLSLFSGFVIAHYSSLPAAGILINFMSVPSFRLLVAILSPRKSGSYSRLCHVGILLDNLTLGQDDSEHFVIPYHYHPLISQTKIAFCFPQNHSTVKLVSSLYLSTRTFKQLLKS